jgi:hypothetical protein
MDKLIIAPTASWSKNAASREQLNDVIKDSPNAVKMQQKIGSMMLPKTGTNKSRNDAVKVANIYQDMRQISSSHVRNRKRDLQIFETDRLYSQHPMRNISFPSVEGENLKLLHGWTNV